MKKYCYLIFVAFVSLGIAGSVSAIPQLINYQGFLTDDAGVPVADGDYSLTFRIWDAETGPTQLWSEDHPTVSVANGLFNVILGSYSPLTLPFDADYWLGVQIQAEPELPRIRLTSVGYSYRAGEADHAVYADTADYALAANVAHVDSASVAANAWRWANHPWGTEVPLANWADTAAYALGGGGIGGSGTANYVPLWTGATTLDNSRIRQNAHTTYITDSTSRTPNFSVYSDATSDDIGIFGSNLWGGTSDGSNWGWLGFGHSGVVGANEEVGRYCAGVHGITFESSDDNAGVVGTNWNGGVWGGLACRSGGLWYAGYFDGDVKVNGVVDATDVLNVLWDDAGNYIHPKEANNFTIYDNSPTYIGLSYVNETNTSAVTNWNNEGMTTRLDYRTAAARYAGYFVTGGDSAGTDYGIYARSDGEYAGYFAGDVFIAGDYTATGAKMATVEVDGESRQLYSQESPEVWFEDFGEGELVNGRAHIELDPIFLKTLTIDARHPMKVFVQLTSGEPVPVVVTKGTTGFDVRVADATSNVSFDYRVVAKRKGYEDVRLEKVEKVAEPLEKIGGAPSNIAEGYEHIEPTKPAKPKSGMKIEESPAGSSSVKQK